MTDFRGAAQDIGYRWRPFAFRPASSYSGFELVQIFDGCRLLSNFDVVMYLQAPLVPQIKAVIHGTGQITCGKHDHGLGRFDYFRHAISVSDLIAAKEAYFEAKW